MNLCCSVATDARLNVACILSSNITVQYHIIVDRRNSSVLKGKIDALIE